MNPAPEVPIQPDDHIVMRSVALGDIGGKRPYRVIFCKDCALVLHDWFVTVTSTHGPKYHLCFAHGLAFIETLLLTRP